MDVIRQGLSLSALGMGLTFAALGLLILAMFVLERIFRPRRLTPEEGYPEEMPVASSLAHDIQEETVVAIAVALAHLRSLDLRRSELGEALEAGPGPWGMKHITRESR